MVLEATKLARCCSMHQCCRMIADHAIRRPAIDDSSDCKPFSMQSTFSVFQHPITIYKATYTVLQTERKFILM